MNNSPSYPLNHPEITWPIDIPVLHLPCGSTVVQEQTAWVDLFNFEHAFSNARALFSSVQGLRPGVHARCVHDTPERAPFFNRSVDENGVVVLRPNLLAGFWHDARRGASPELWTAKADLTDSTDVEWAA